MPLSKIIGHGDTKYFWLAIIVVLVNSAWMNYSQQRQIDIVSVKVELLRNQLTELMQRELNKGK